jgi:cysteinyl-tRNA synthetase
MSMKYLGATIDFHGGGIENQFPHHECEIAQSEAANGVPFVRYWVHNNMVTVNGQKMGKSLGNFITLKQIFKEGHPVLSRKYDPLAVRQLILQSHYRSPIDFSDAALTAAQSGYDKIKDAVISIRQQMARAVEGPADPKVIDELQTLRQKFDEAMNDDLNSAVALSVMFEMVRLAGRLVQESCTTQTLKAVDDQFRMLGGNVLGIILDEYPTPEGGNHALLDHLLGILIEQRKQARARKDFAAGDAIRNQLDSFGILLEDKPGGVTTWRRK